MFTHIKTSKENKERVGVLTRRLNLGAENVIARIALTYSLSQNRKMNLEKIQNASGKEYSRTVLFGDFLAYYMGMVALNYNLHISDKDLPKYAKMHIDDGLELLDLELKDRSNVDGFDFLVEKIELSLSELV